MVTIPLATRDFELALRLLVGEEASLSPSTISRLPREFKEQYEAFDAQDLSDRPFVYIWADGICLKAGPGTVKACLMVLIAADTAGQKHLIALWKGYREGAERWGDLIRDWRQRGLNEPACWIAEGPLSSTQGTASRSAAAVGACVGDAEAFQAARLGRAGATPRRRNRAETGFSGSMARAATGRRGMTARGRRRRTGRCRLPRIRSSGRTPGRAHGPSRNRR